MCGIAGLLPGDPRAIPDARVLAAMARTLSHRGPDEERIEARPGLGIAFRRLSVIDPRGGSQPLWNETGDVAVACNGEIYNFEALRAELSARGHRFRTDSDVEAIVHLYEEHGAGLAERLVGMFALCVLDGRDPA